MGGGGGMGRMEFGLSRRRGRRILTNVDARGRGVKKAEKNVDAIYEQSLFYTLNWFCISKNKRTEKK